MSSMFGKSRTSVMPDRAECNVAVLGVRGSGKSALTVKFLTRRFISEYDPNMEDIYSSEEIVDQQPVLVKVMDTADQDGPVNCERYLTWASAFLVVYSIDDRRTFEGCQRYLDLVAAHAKSLQVDLPVLLLGNKSASQPRCCRWSVDLTAVFRHRQVSESDGCALASDYGCLFYEVSACQDFVSVQRVFHEAVREARRDAERGRPTSPLFISEDRPPASLATTLPLGPGLGELPTPAGARVVPVKSSRAQSKRRAPTLTLLKGFRIF